MGNDYMLVKVMIKKTMDSATANKLLRPHEKYLYMFPKIYLAFGKLGILKKYIKFSKRLS